MKKVTSALAVILLATPLITLGCGSTTSIGAGGGNHGGGGGIAISFPLESENSDSGYSTTESTTTTEAGMENADPNSPSGTALNSNLLSAYPKHNCYQPMKPSSDDSSGQYMIYKQQLDKYRLCIDTYVKNAKNDMIDIENKANNAMREYRLFVNRP